MAGTVRIDGVNVRYSLRDWIDGKYSPQWWDAEYAWRCGRDPAQIIAATLRHYAECPRDERNRRIVKAVQAADSGDWLADQTLREFVRRNLTADYRERLGWPDALNRWLARQAVTVRRRKRGKPRKLDARNAEIVKWVRLRRDRLDQFPERAQAVDGTKPEAEALAIEHIAEKLAVSESQIRKVWAARVK